jgi:hypothetical protein
VRFYNLSVIHWLSLSYSNVWSQIAVEDYELKMFVCQTESRFPDVVFGWDYDDWNKDEERESSQILHRGKYSNYKIRLRGSATQGALTLRLTNIHSANV